VSEDPANRPTPHTPPPGLEALPPAMRAQYEAVRAELDATLLPHLRVTPAPWLPPNLVVFSADVPRVLLPERLAPQVLVPEVLLPPETVAASVSEAYARMPVPEVPTPGWVQTPVQGQMLRDINAAIAAYARERPATPLPEPERDLLDRIDAELIDWELGPDAARRHPDGVYPFPIGPHPARRSEQLRVASLDRDEITVVFEAIVPVVRAAVTGVQAFAAQIGRVAQQLQEMVGRVNEASGYTLAPSPLPQDPRERALAARRNRNTGPPAPPTRLPRHHGPRRN
jgi:hypothetical protein